jgi:heat shock protein HslJ
MISGKFSISQDKVIFGEGLSTRKFCQGIDEQKFHNVLNLTNRMQIKNDALFLFENDKKLAEFIRE